MFNLKNYKLVKKLKNINIKSEWLKYASNPSGSASKEELLNAIMADNKFIEQDLELRNMVEDMLVEEFTEEIKKNKSYDFLVDSVVNRLKQKQMGDIDSSEDVI